MGTALVWRAEDVRRLGIDDEVVAYLAEHGLQADRCPEFEVTKDGRLRARIYRVPLRVDLGEIVSDVVEVPMKSRPTFAWGGAFSCTAS